MFYTTLVETLPRSMHGFGSKSVVHFQTRCRLKTKCRLKTRCRFSPTWFLFNEKKNEKQLTKIQF